MVLALVAIAALFVSSLEESGRRPIHAGRGEDWSGVELVTVVVAGRTFDRDGGPGASGARGSRNGDGRGLAGRPGDPGEAPRLRGMLADAEGIVLLADGGAVRLLP